MIIEFNDEIIIMKVERKDAIGKMKSENNL